MPQGIAIRVGAAPDRFYPGSDIYQLFPSLGQFEGRDDHVVVALSPRAVDHGQKETTIFRCTRDGKLEPFTSFDNGAEALERHQRIVGRHDAQAALANLGGTGYLVVQAQELPALKAIALAQAEAFAREKNFLSPQEYASDNWGLFAGHHLVSAGQRDPAVRCTNEFFDEVPA